MIHLQCLHIMADSDIKAEDLRNVIKSKASGKLPEPVAVIDSEDSYPFMVGYKILETKTDLIWFKQGKAVPLPNLMIIKRVDL